MNSIIGGLKEGRESKLGSPQDRIKSKMKRYVLLLHWCVEDSEYLTFRVNRGGTWATREQWGVLVHIFPRGRLRLRGVQKRRLPWYLKGALSKMHKNNGRGPLKAKVNLSPPAVTCPVVIGSSRVVTFTLSLSGVPCSPFFHSHRQPGNRVLWSCYTYTLRITWERQWKEERTWTTEIIKLVARVYLWERMAFLFPCWRERGSWERLGFEKMTGITFSLRIEE